MSGRRILGLLLVCLALAGLTALLLRRTVGDGREQDLGPNVLLVVVDTMRADHLGCYGWSENTSPNIDALAAQGVLFEQMICQVPQTLPSFCTILTGTYPVTHGVRVNGVFSLPPERTTLAEIFHQAGYRTAAFIAGFPLDSQFGLNQGFDLYDDTMRSRRKMTGLKQTAEGALAWDGFETDAFENTADVVTDHAIRWLEEFGERPFFVMVHYFDPHHDYAPPPRFRNEFRHPYSGEVAFMDDQLGRLLGRLDELGATDRTLVILTGDHGECLGEHGRYYHQSLLFEAALHVPLVARLPGRIVPGSRVSGTCRSVDLMPTILELARRPLPEQAQGTSLVSTLVTGRTGDLPCFVESLYTKLEAPIGVTRYGVRSGRWKYAYTNQEARPGRPRKEWKELYDLDSDPEELVNLAGRNPEKAGQLHRSLQEFLENTPGGRATIVTPDERTLEKLEALGY